jgi:hypothetical protein
MANIRPATAKIVINFFTLYSSKNVNKNRFEAVRADSDVAGNKKGILILTMSTKPAISFLLLITLSLRPSSSCHRLAWWGSTQLIANIILSAETYNVKRKIEISVKNSCELGKKMVTIR